MNIKCICDDCDIYGCKPDCDPCFGVLPTHVQKLIEPQRRLPVDGILEKAEDAWGDNFDRDLRD